jgi:hypothetical protein
MNTRSPRDAISGRAAALILAVIMVGSVVLRLPALHWLANAGPYPDFSFHPDVGRFITGAQDIKVPDPEGYPEGLTTHLYLLHKLLAPLTGAGYMQILHSITLFYAAMIALLTYVTARSWNMSRGTALLAAGLWSIAPGAVVQSNFGTADLTAVFYFYATLLVGGQFLRTGKSIWFVLLCALVGMAVAVKFFIPLFAPLFLVLAMQRRDQIAAAVLAAFFIVPGSFEMMSFFRYTPWDLHHLYWMLRDDTVFIGGPGPLGQLRVYSSMLVTSIGIPMAVLLAIGVVRWLPSLRRSVPAIVNRAFSRDWRALITPATLFIAAFSLHAFLLLMAGAEGVRHLLVFLPAVCIASAYTLLSLLEVGRVALAVRWSIVAILVGFQTYDSIAIESIFRHDIRNELAAWTDKQVADGKKVTTMMVYSEVRGSTYDQDQNPLDLGKDAYLIVCDLEYDRYLGQGSAEGIFHAVGGQPRLEFYRHVFKDGQSEFGIVREFVSQPEGLELRLIARNKMALLDSSVPRRCFALGRDNQLPKDEQQRIRDELATLKNGDGW